MSSAKLTGHPLIVAATLALWVGLASRPGVTADPPGLFFFCASLVLFCAGTILFTRARLARTRALGLLGLVAFLFWSAASAHGSIDPFLSKLSLAEWIACLGLFSALSVSVDNKEAWALGAHCVILSTLGTCVYGFVRELQAGGVLISNFTNPDCFSVLPMVATLLALGLVDRAEGRERHYLIAVIPLLTLCVILTSSRAGVLGLVAGSALFAWSTRRRPGARTALVMALAAPVLAGLLLLSFGESDLLTSKWNELLNRREVGVQARLDVATYGLKAARERPLTGSGPGTFHLAYQQVRPNTQGEDYMNVAHDDYLQVAVETGFVGFLLCFGSLSFCLVQGLRNGSGSGLFHYYGAAAAIVAVGVYSTANFAVPVPVDLAYWLIPASLALCYRQEPCVPRAFARLIGISLAALGVTGCYLGARVAWNNHSLELAQRYQDALNWSRARAELEAGTDHSDLRILLGLATNAEKLAAFNADPALKEVAIQDLRSALALSPHNLVAMLRLADLLETKRDYAGALALQEQARRESPQTHALDLVVARNLLLQGKFEEAAQALRVGGHEDIGSLGDLLVVIEQMHKGSAPQELQRWFASSPELAAKVAHKAGDSAIRIGNQQLAIELYRWLLKKNPREHGVSFELAQLEPDPKLKLKMLDQELKLSNSEDVTPAALQMWTELKLQNGTARNAIPRLEAYLVKQPRSNAIRLVLSQTYTQLGLAEEARRVLRDGLDYDRDGSLSVALGGLFEKEGDAEIALSYYEDAHRAHPENVAIGAAIERLKSNPEALTPGFKDATKARKRNLQQTLDGL